MNDTERFMTIMGSMYDGDLRPLATAIMQGQTIDAPILWYLAIMINDGLVIAKNRITVRRPRGRPKQFDKSARDRLAVLRYQELRKTLSSEGAFQKAATDFRMTEASLRKALASRRNKKVAGEVAPVDNRPLKNGLHVARDWRRVGWGEGAREKWRGYWNRLRKLPTEEKREIWARCSEMALRMATIVAVYRGSDVVDVEDLEWSIALAEHSTAQIEAGLSKHMLETLERADLLDHVRRTWSQRKRMTQGQVMKACERKTDDRRKILDVIQTLNDAGEIVELANEYGPGRPTQTWLWKG